MADDLSSGITAPRGVDLVAGRAGSFVRGQGGYTPTPTGVQAAAFVTPWVEVAGHGTLRVDVTNLAGSTGTATVTLQTSYDAGVTDAAATVGAPTAAVAAGSSARVRAPGCDRWVRASVAVAGGNVNCTISGEVV